jgi:hypothetical protein
MSEARALKFYRQSISAGKGFDSRAATVRSRHSLGQLPRKRRQPVATNCGVNLNRDRQTSASRGKSEFESGGSSGQCRF